MSVPADNPAHEDQVGFVQPRDAHLWFNVELAKKHSDCLEYIVVHEMAHY